MRIIYILIMIFMSVAAADAAEEMNFGERLTCGISASIKHDIPADILLAISTIENGQPGVGYRNTNGSIDYGIMQINSIYLKELKDKYNIIVTPAEVAAPTCKQFEIAAFKIKEHLRNDTGSFLERVAMYHSKSEDLNRAYQTKLIKHSSEWRKIFKAKEYTTYIWQEEAGL